MTQVSRATLNATTEYFQRSGNFVLPWPLRPPDIFRKESKLMAVDCITQLSTLKWKQHRKRQQNIGNDNKMESDGWLRDHII